MRRAACGDAKGIETDGRASVPYVSFIFSAASFSVRLCFNATIVNLLSIIRLIQNKERKEVKRKMVDLDQLKSEIEAVGNKIKELKGSGGAKEDIGAAVKELLAKKQLYADNNNGIGVDGKPMVSKAEKKKLEKAQKQQNQQQQPQGQVRHYYHSL